MAVIKIKTSVEKKDEKLKNVRDIIKTLHLVYADEHTLIGFEGKFQDWTNKVVKEWRSCKVQTSDEFMSSKIFRMLSTAFIFVCFLEFLRGCFTDAPNVSYMTLPVIYYLLLALMDLTSVVLITYLRSPSTFFYQIYEYFEMVLCMSRLLNHRINSLRQRMNLNEVGQNNLPPDMYAFEENSKVKFSYSLFSLYSLYGVYLALCIFIQFSYFRCESLIVLIYLTFNLLFLVGSSKVFAILKFLRRNVQGRKNVQALTDEFKTWFDNECELKRILQESGENTKIFSAFSHQSSKTFPADEYLNFLVFASISQGIFRSNFSDRDLERAVFMLLYGELNFPKRDSRSNEFIQITTSCNEHIKSIKFLDESAVTVEDEKTPQNETKTKKMIKPAGNKKMKENVSTEDNKVVKEKTLQNKKKTQIPRLVCSKKQTSLPSKAKMPPVPTSNVPVEDTLQPTSHEENLGNLNDLPDQQNSVHHFNSQRAEVNDEDLTGIPVTPSTSASSTDTNVTPELLLDDENSVYQKSTSMEGNSELANHSKLSRGRKNDEVDLNGTSVTAIIIDSRTVMKTTLQDENLGGQNDTSTEQKTYSVVDYNSHRGENEGVNIGTPKPPLISDSDAVMKTSLQTLLQDETLRDQNDLLVEQNSYPDIYPNKGNEENNAEVDFIGTSETPLISNSSTVMKTTLQAPVQGGNLRVQNDLPAEQNSYPDIHPNSRKEEENVEVDFNGTPETPLNSDSSTVMKTTHQAPVQGGNLRVLNDLPAEKNSYPDIHPNSRHEEENAEVDFNGTPETPLNSDSSAVMTITLQAPVQDGNLRVQNDLPAEKNSYPDIHPNSGNEEENAEVDFDGTPETPLNSVSSAVMKTTLQEPFQDENLRDKNDLPAEQNSYPDIHPISRNEEENAEVDFTGTPETPLISESNTVIKTTQQAPFEYENLNDQNDLSVEQKSDPDSYIHLNSGNDENNSKVDFNLILANEEEDISANLFLAVNTSRKCYKIITETDFINETGLNKKIKELCINNNENIEADIPYYSENENTPTAQNSGSMRNKTEPSSNSAIDLTDDTKFGGKVSNESLYKSSGDEVKCVSNPLFSNKERVIDGCNDDDMDFNKNNLSDPDTGRLTYLDKGDEKNAPSLKGSEEIERILRNETPSKSLEVTSREESSSQNGEMQSNSLDYRENQTDNLKRPETGKGENRSLINFSPAEEELSTNRQMREEMEESLERIRLNGYSTSNNLSDSQRVVVDNFISACNEYMSNEEQAEDELSTAQVIDSSNDNERMKKLLECIFNLNSDQNMNGLLSLNYLSDTEKIVIYNFLLTGQQYLHNEVAEFSNYPESSPKDDEDEDLSECLAKLHIQSEDAPSIATNENIPQSNSSSAPTGSTPKIKPSAFVDVEQSINEGCFEQNTPNNDVEQYELPYDSQKGFLTRNGKELNESSNSSVLIKVGEKHTVDENNKNSESKQNFPHFQLMRTPARDDLKPNETICPASCDNSEINKLGDKCSENTEMPAEDALNCNGSEPKLRNDNSCLSNDDKTAEASVEIKAKNETAFSTREISEHKPAGDVAENVQHFSANNSALPMARKIAKRRTRRVVENRQVNKKEADGNLGELKESENVNRLEALDIGTNSSKVSPAKPESTTFNWGNLINLPWGNSVNLNNQNETAQACGPPEEIISQVQNEIETKTSVSSANLNGVARLSSKNVEPMKSSDQGDDSKKRDLEGNDPGKSSAFPPDFSISNSHKPRESISHVTISQNEVDTNVSLSKSPQADPRNNRESTQMNDDLTSAMEMRYQVSIPPIIKEEQKNTTEEKICQEQTTVISEKGESNRKDQANRERDKSCYSHADKLKECSKDLPAARSVNESCDTIESSSDLNRGGFMSLNERKIMVADHSQKCTELEENNVFQRSLDVSTHSNEKVFQDMICETDEIFTGGGEKNICIATSPLTDGENSQNYNKKESRKVKGQSKTQRISDSAATNDKTVKHDLNSEDSRNKKRSTEERTRKKEKRYVCLQKYRNIVAEEDSTTERYEIERLERQASYVSSCEKLSVTQEKTSLRMLDKRNGQSENTRKAGFNQFSENIGFDCGAKNKHIKEWIKSVTSLESSSTLNERPPTGSSEEQAFRFHPSTSVSNSNATKNTKTFSESSVDPPIYPSFPEEKQSDHDKEISELKSASNAFNEFGKGGMKWQSNLDCHDSEKDCTEHRRVNDCRSFNNECLDIEKESTPVNYHLKCDNLDITFLDSQPNLTLRFVKEAQNEPHLVPTRRKLIETLIHSDCEDEIFLPTDQSSLHNGHVLSTHPLEIPKIRDTGNTVQMSAEPLPTGLIGNLDHPNASIGDKVSPFDNPLDKNSQERNEVVVLETEKSCSHPISVNERLKHSSPNQRRSDILPPEDSELQEIAAIASASNDPKIKPVANVCAVDTKLKNGEKSEDFVFESETMKIDYKPYSNSESLSISYRRQRTASKLTFKSPEKKLYLKTSKSRVKTDFEGNMVDDSW